jgi:hypothetical protein
MMRTTYAILLAVAAATFAAACSKTPEPAGPVADSSMRTVAPNPDGIAPPATKPPEVPLPPLPSDITAPKASDQPTARDTHENAPNADLTARQEANEMPKANQANNHSSTALDKEPAAAQTEKQ